MFPNKPQAWLPKPSCFLTSPIKKSPDTPECGHSRKCVLKVERLPRGGYSAVPTPSGGRGRTVGKLGAPRELRGDRGTVDKAFLHTTRRTATKRASWSSAGATPAQPGLVTVLDPRFCPVRPSQVLPAVLPPPPL